MWMLWNRASASSPTRARRSAEIRWLAPSFEQGLRPVHGRDRARPRRHAVASPRRVLEPCLVRQAILEIGIVVGPVEGLLEPPVREVPRSSRPLHVLELLQRHLNRGIPQQRSFPVPLERQQALRKALRVSRADEVPAVLPQDVDRARIRVPAQARTRRSC